MKPFKQITIVFVSGIIYLVSNVLIGSESILKNSTQKQEETKSKKRNHPPNQRKKIQQQPKKIKNQEAEQEPISLPKKTTNKSQPTKKPGINRVFNYIFGERITRKALQPNLHLLKFFHSVHKQ